MKFHLTDHFLPSGLTDADTVRRTRAAIFQTWVGLTFTLLFSALYAGLGSTWSGAAISLLSIGLIGTPFAIRRGVTVDLIGNVMIALTWIATFVVASRTGGFDSPAVAWAFFPPLSTYAVFGGRSAVTWACLAAFQIAFFYVAELAQVPFPQDLSHSVRSAMRLSTYLGVVVATTAVLAFRERARVAALDSATEAQRAFERERILGDMHDGVGSQLLGLMMQLRAGSIDQARLVAGLESCLDDLHLIVDSLDPMERSFEVALAELRSRVEPRCHAAGVELTWQVKVDPVPRLAPEATMQVLRALQEMLSNALRHSQTRQLDLRIGSSTANELEVSVRDHGIGFELDRAPRRGRGLNSLRTRARKLGGTLTVTQASPGACVSLRFPIVER